MVTEVLGRPLTHAGFVVDDIAAAIDEWATAFGAGPFFVMEHPSFEQLDYGDGKPALFDHAAAFGQWGPIAVELQEIRRVEPALLADRLAGAAPRLNHLSYMTSDLEAESARLEGRGMPKLLYGRGGPVEVAFHDAPQLGVPLEVHRESEFLADFYEMLRQANAEWDGAERARPLPI